MTGLSAIRRRAVLVLALLWLAGCATAGVPFVEGTQPAVLEDTSILTPDNVRLPLLSWRPAGEPQAVVLALHGFNDYSKSFQTVGPYLAARGVAVYAYDQRGFGASPNPGLWPGAERLIADLRIVADLVHRRHPNSPLFLLGESMGGAVVMAALADPSRNDRLAGIVRGTVLVGPAVWGRTTMNPLYRVALWLTDSVVPGLAVTAPRELGIRPSDNLPMLRALSRDPLVIKATRVDAIRGLVDLMDLALASAPRFKAPSLLLYGANDQIIPKEPIARLLANLPAGRQQVAYYPNGWHMLLRDLNAEVVLADVAAWITDSRRPLPSGADRQGRNLLAVRPLHPEQHS